MSDGEKNIWACQPQTPIAPHWDWHPLSLSKMFRCPNNSILLQLQQKRVFRSVCIYSHRHEEVSWDRTPQTKELLLLFFFFFKLYNIVLVLPNIEMNPPQVYPRSPSWTLLPPPSPTLPLGRPSAPAPSIQYRALNLNWRLVSYMILYMFQCYSPKSPHPLPLPQSP